MGLLSFFKSGNYFDKGMTPKCDYCQNGKRARDGNKVLCEKRGLVDCSYSCSKFIYSPLKRIPVKQLNFVGSLADEDIYISYTPFGHSDWQSIVSDIKKFGTAGKKAAVVSTINGDANVPFYKELANQGVSAKDIPVVAFSVGEEELTGIDTKPLVGHLAAWNYFESVDCEANEEFIEAWHKYTGNENRVTNDPMEATYIGFNMWVKAVEKAGTTDSDAVQDALIGVAVPNLSGGTATMMPNHHITKPVLIGEIQDDGQFEVVDSTPTTVVADEWSDYLDGSKDLIADWRAPLKCGNFNVKTGKCGGSGK